MLTHLALTTRATQPQAIIDEVLSGAHRVFATCLDLAILVLATCPDLATLIPATCLDLAILVLAHFESFECTDRGIIPLKPLPNTNPYSSRQVPLSRAIHYIYTNFDFSDAVSQPSLSAPFLC
ncbi:hypothetical protein BJV78DRAFT_1219703 [Lactifluus subvellereus]|nr:hypothetical protein BJV78DRAFT_1219703 [Lactifluus subvellereus]